MLRTSVESQQAGGEAIGLTLICLLTTRLEVGIKCYFSQQLAHVRVTAD